MTYLILKNYAQIDWQIHQNFIGFAVHFKAGAVDPSVCYDRTLFEFVFTGKNSIMYPLFLFEHIIVQNDSLSGSL